MLLLGESGTGKEVVRARHPHVERAARRGPSSPSTARRCRETLLESELFGHEKGAFTGAHRAEDGPLELADGGTVFLDEIGDMLAGAAGQAAARPAGAGLRAGRAARGRSRSTCAIIAATNRDLEAAVKDGRFREDLYHRLNVMPITLPPLRERREDIPALAQFFLERFARETTKGFVEIAPDALERLYRYGWPGNVRELGNVVERAIVLGRPPRVTLEDLPPRVVAPEPKDDDGEATSYATAVNAYRRRIIAAALARSGGNRAAAAATLGLHRTHLMRLLKALRIE